MAALYPDRAREARRPPCPPSNWAPDEYSPVAASGNSMLLKKSFRHNSEEFQILSIFLYRLSKIYA